MGMHAVCGHGMIMATSMAQFHMQVMTKERRSLFHITPVRTVPSQCAHIMSTR